MDKKDKLKNDLPPSYHAIDVADNEDEPIVHTKNEIRKSKPSTPEVDGADEKMLPKQEIVELKPSLNDNQNGEAKLDIGDLKNEFVGLTKEELMKYATDPFWVRLRWVLFIGFWILWALMLLGAILIILAAPKCNPPPPKTWWEKGPLIEINDNLDINKLKDLKVTGVIMSLPGDIYNNIDETNKVIQQAKQYEKEGINVIMELEPGHSQIWFEKSENNDPEFNDYYIWAPAKSLDNNRPQPPNNWVSIENTTAWKFSNKRNEYYYSPTTLPHLNFRNSNVTQEFSNIIKKLLNFGIAGIRIKGAPFLLVDDKLTDDSNVPNFGDCDLTQYCFYTHFHTEHRIELGPLLKQWRVIVKNNTINGPFLISEDISPNIQAYKVNNSFVVDLPLQAHVFIKPKLNITSVVNAINATFTANNITWPLWNTTTDHTLNLITYFLPGTPLLHLDSSNNSELIKIRESPAIMRGSLTIYALNGTVLAFTRVTPGSPGILVAFNPSENSTVIDFPSNIKSISDDVTVLVMSQNFNETDIRVNVKHEANSVPMPPNSAIVLSYVPKSKTD